MTGNPTIHYQGVTGFQSQHWEVNHTTFSWESHYFVHNVQSYVGITPVEVTSPANAVRIHTLTINCLFWSLDTQLDNKVGYKTSH